MSENDKFITFLKPGMIIRHRSSDKVYLIVNVKDLGYWRTSLIETGKTTIREFPATSISLLEWEVLNVDVS